MEGPLFQCLSYGLGCERSRPRLSLWAMSDLPEGCIITLIYIPSRVICTYKVALTDFGLREDTRVASS